MAEKTPTHAESLATRYETPALEPLSDAVASSGHDRALRDRLGDRMRDRAQSLERGKKGIVTNTIRHVISDQGLDLAAGLAFYALLSMAPATLALVSMLGVVGEAKSTTEAVLGLASDLSTEAAEAIRPLVTELVSTPAAGLTLIVSVAFAIWSSSKYVGAFGRASNRAYAVEETRPLWKLKPMMLFITLVLLLLMAGLGLLLVVSGPIAESIGRLVGLGPVAVMIWSIARWPVVIFFVMLAIALLYYATPNVKMSKFRWTSIGAFVALISLILVSLGFVLYINNFDNYNAAYGAIGGVIVGFAWLWMVNLALIFGAELDAEIERSRTSD
ncbi:YihY/virulence factor BrkB family protein [Brevibacterium sp. UCMA 11754]|uniref:YihY/virulence factor BrkB family protein n=1 Tax=Brevibacterium sp. UCMA 11754 TaxID=2749198 RepID=UPI001F36D867|nr:YihY/virulence factor BrkB family protein [Brevibacterium sp. UCMA 11754]MCF2573995.1 YihY/virulence factor BrkB family protein [Brevibacterium sp. UCMA 11754]